MAGFDSSVPDHSPLIPTHVSWTTGRPEAWQRECNARIMPQDNQKLSKALRLRHREGTGKDIEKQADSREVAGKSFEFHNILTGYLAFTVQVHLTRHSHLWDCT